ncbi:hypothetical protein K503DRAFT_858860 [Rhizopogon vinicolor AM-OR11-026]|uniref:CHAT domain-containing protein n=1 Tax=Rhizopogon vinicolor AM-OR11-026 TaxID=1314800 RepID=A0A1B7MQX8_9AGAM|nr:hypothetical protein K503DRAFT_858860 [Rhizopogon vinicolor AM-OR11-026]
MTDTVERSRVIMPECPPARYSELLITKHANNLPVGFEHQDALSDLDKAVGLHRAAVALHPPGHSAQSSSLNNLATSLQDRFKQQGVLSDLDEAIDLHRAVLALLPFGHSDQSISLNNLAVGLQTRFEQRGVPSDLNEAIDIHRATLALCPPGHSMLSTSLNNLASSLGTRFKQQGVLSDLSEAIDLHRAALALFLDLSNKRGVMSDLEETINLHGTALALCPSGHSNRYMSLNNLANSLRARFRQQGILSDLDQAIDLYQAALLLCPPGHFARSSSLTNLASSLEDRFEQQGVTSDLDEAIDLHQAALALCPPGYSEQSMYLNNLATSLQARFEQQGVLSDLDKVIDLYQSALALCPPGHSDRSMSLSHLAGSLGARFEQRGVLSDLDEAIDLHRAALLLCPLGHSDHSLSLNNLAVSLQDRFEQQDNLATSLQERFEQRGVLSDLDEAIDLHQAALALCPPDHYTRSSLLNNFAISLQERFKQQGVLSDLDEAIDLHRAALALHLPGHSDRSLSLNNLAVSLRKRFEQRGVLGLSDLDEAIELHQAALVLCPPDHSTRSSSLNNLAISLQDRFGQQGVLSDLNEAIDLHRAVLALMVACFWKVTSSLAVDAFSCSIRHGALTTAVELVEQGRAVFWTQLARFHTPLDEISTSGDIGKALATEFKEVSIRLRNMLEVSSEDQISQINQLTTQRDNVISRIRMLPGFSRFLLHPLFSDLQKAAEDGPVIIMNASKYSCNALIILSAQDPVHISLDIARAEVSDLSDEFQSLTEGAGCWDNQLGVHQIIGILRELWERIVGPIVKVLRDIIPHGSRIWWCPTAEFTLLPLHAAGPYAEKSRNLSHFYISSYTPTLAALIRARQQVPRDDSIPHFVTVGQGSPGNCEQLLHVAAELADVARRVGRIFPFTSLVDSDATAQRALDAFSQHQWVHLACHGMPNRQKLFDSSFAMRDGPLKISDIMQPHLQNPDFAFLSACHTTVGHASSPDEAIHLAAAMQFSGFRSVIGSMWSVDDEVVGQVVSAFYDNMVDGSGRLDCKRAVVALHEAMKKLRKKIPFEQQIITQLHTAAAMWNIIWHYSGVSEDTSQNMERLVDGPSNGMMPNRAVHTVFDMLKVYLERTERENEYVVKESRLWVHPRELLSKTITFRNHAAPTQDLPLPKPRSIALHAGISRILHMGGAA